MCSKAFLNRWIGGLFWIGVSLTVRGDERVRIVEVRDAGLFRTHDGRWLTLAHIRIPSITDPNPVWKQFARQIQKEMGKQVSRQEVWIRIDSTADRGDTLAVFMWQKYTLNAVSLNKMYLESGFGLYLPPPGRVDPVLSKAAEKARLKGRGLFNPNLFSPVHRYPYHRRLRLFVHAGYWQNKKQKQTKGFIVPSFQCRWSRFSVERPPEQVEAAWSWEIGSYLLVLPYFSVGPEFRWRGKWSFSPSGGALFMIHPLFFTLTESDFTPFYYGFKWGGLIGKPAEARWEWEISLIRLHQGKRGFIWGFIGFGRSFSILSP